MHGTLDLPGPASLRTAAKHVVMVGSLTTSLMNFRGDLLRALVAEGHRVTAMGPERHAATEARLAKMGVAFRAYPLARTGTNPVEDAQSLRALVGAFRALRPDAAVFYTMKPVIYGGLAARMAGVPERHALMTGMGHVYSPGAQRLRDRAVRRVSDGLYRAALKGARTVFTYNEADERDIRERRMIGASTAMVRVPGSGVDTARFRPRPPPPRPVFAMIARLLRDKGVEEFVEAARILRPRWPEATFRLVGPFDPGRNGVRPEAVEAWVKEGAILYDGAVSDVRPVLEEASAFVLPSFYREGVPRTILEAMACGRAVVTTDLPGCRDAVEDGANGFLVGPRDAESLAAALLRFRDRPELLARMGERARQAAARFDVHRVNRLILEHTGLVR